MKTAVNRLISWRALIATFAICCVAPPARADLTLTFAVGTTAQTVTGLSNGSTGTLSYFTGNTLDYTVAYTVTSAFNPVTQTQTESLQATIAGAAGRTFVSSTPFSYSLRDTTLTTPGSTGSSVSLRSALAATSNSGQPAFIETDVDLLPTGGGDVSTAPITVFGTGTAASAPVATTRPASYDFLVSGSGTIINGTGFSTTFTATGTLTVNAVPEPSVVMAAVAGLPCMGLLVRLTRRGRGCDASDATTMAA